MSGTHRLSRFFTLWVSALLAVACGPQKSTAQRNTNATTSGVDSITHVLPAAPLLGTLTSCPGCTGTPTVSIQYQGTNYFIGTRTSAEAQMQLNTLLNVIGPNLGSLNIAFTGEISQEAIGWIGNQNVIHLTSITRN